MSKKVKFSCQWCNKETEAYKSNRALRFCSTKCYHAYRNSDFDKVCEWCGDEFIGKYSSKFCSKQCRKRSQRERQRVSVIITCPDCGDERRVHRPRYEINSNTRCKKCAGFQAIITKPPLRGSDSPQWKGGRRVDSYGYIKIHCPGHPFSDSTNYVREHLYVATEHYGENYVREAGGVVHHINGKRDDNRIENLYVCDSKQNAQFNRDLLEIAFALVRIGYIEFDDGQYHCPLLSDEIGEAAQTR